MARVSLAFLIIELLLSDSVPAQTVTSPEPEPGYIESLKFLHRGIDPPRVSEATYREANILVSYIEQKLNHFDPNSPTWLMRYASNSEFHRLNGPIFIILGGEAEISDTFVRAGLIYEMAREHSAYLFITEHRFYGKSMPTRYGSIHRDLGLENLRYLTSQQALADLAHFIRTQKARPEFENSKVILAGGSYSGSLAVWAQHLYPDLVQGSWASSAPLLAKLDFPEYKEVVGEAISTMGGHDCYDRFNHGIAQLEEYVNKNQTEKLRETMRVCDKFDIENWLDVAALFSAIANLVSGLVTNHDHGDIKEACKQILSASDHVTGVVNYFHGKVGLSGKTCLDYTFDATVGYLSDIVYKGRIWRQWAFQLCNEFGWTQSTQSQYQPFGSKIPSEFYEYICLVVFNVTVEQQLQNVKDTNDYYGGLKPNVKNVYYSHGGIDPWNKIGILKNDDGKSAIIAYYAHCKDFDTISAYDELEMRTSKKRVQKYVRKWLKDDI